MRKGSRRRRNEERGSRMRKEEGEEVSVGELGGEKEVSWKRGQRMRVERSRKGEESGLEFGGGIG